MNAQAPLGSGPVPDLLARAQAYKASGLDAEALALAEAARRADPLNPAALCLSAACLQASQPAEALRLLELAAAVASRDADVLWSLGHAQRSTGQWSRALATLRTLQAIAPSHPRIDFALALVLLDLRELPKARVHFERALAREPDEPRVQWEFAMERLTAGDWGRGWDLHEARLSVFGWEALNLCPLPWPAWQGEPLDGRTLVVHGEQGVGDEIMYASMVPDLLARGARVVLACVPSLAALMADAFPGVRVVPHPRGQPGTWRHSLPEWVARVNGIESVDFQIPMGSLGRWLRREAADFPGQPYLRPDAARVQAMRAHLDAASADWTPPQDAATQGATPQLPSPPIRVGVAWCGNLDNPHGRAKSLAPAHLLPLAQVPGVQLVGLQSRQYAAEALRVPGLRLIDMSAHTDDFADLAALATQMDLIVSIDSAYVHLCGALGLPVWLPLRRNCDWRWGWRQPHSPWYPRLRLFHQDEDGDWAPVVAQLQDALVQWVRTARTEASSPTDHEHTPDRRAAAALP